MSDELAATVAGLERDVRNLKGWQQTQNGALVRLGERVDHLLYWIMGAVLTSALAVIGMGVNIAIALLRR